MPRILFIALLVLYVASNPLYAQKKNRGKKRQSNKEEQVLEMDRVSGERAFFEGIKYRAVDNFEEAIVSFEASLSFIPTNDAAHYELAVIYFKELDFNRADYHLTQALSIDPSNTWYMAFLAEIYVGNNKFPEAVSLFENLHEMEPSKRSHLNNIAIVELMMGDTLSALDSYGEYVERYGLDDEVYGPYIEVLKEQRAWADMEELSKRCFIERGGSAQSFQDHLAALLYQGKDHAVEVWLGEGKKIKELAPAVVDFSANRALSKGDITSWLNDLRALNDFGNQGFSFQKEQINQWVKSYSNLTDKRIVAFVDTMVLHHEASDDLKFLITLYMLYQKHHEYEKMIGALTQGINLDKGDFRLWRELFYAYYDAEDYESLLRVTEESTAYFFAQPLIFFMQGVAYSKLGQLPAAIESWNKTIPLAFSSQPTLYIQTLTMLFDVYEEASNTQDALGLLTAQGDVNRFKSYEIVEFLGDSYARFGQASDAVLFYEQAIKLGGPEEFLQQKILGINP